MRYSMALAPCGLFFALAVPPCPAQWSNLVAKNPTDTSLSLRLTEPHRYREGELIRAEVKFSAPSLTPAGQEPSRGMWQFAGMLLDPAADCGTPASPCQVRRILGAGIGGIGPPELRIGQTYYPVAATLNNYLPRLRPGRYRIAMLVRKLDSSMWIWTPVDPPRYTVSNTVEIEVAAASAAWVRDQLARISWMLNGSASPGRNDPTRSDPAEQLRFLDAPAAWRLSLSLLPKDEGQLLEGMAETREPARVCALMQAALPAPAQAVSFEYLYAMARTCAPKDAPGAEAKEAAALAASLPLKRGEAKPIALNALIDVALGGPAPAWAPAVRGEFLKWYAATGGRQPLQSLLRFATAAPAPEVIPLLEAVMNSWNPNDQSADARAALQGLYACDPARAQARIAAELAKDRTWLDVPDLDMLPAGDARIDVAALMANAGAGNPALRMTALAKYAGPADLDRIKAIYEAQPDSCQPELMAYFVRADPDYADRVFHSHPWDMRASPPACMLRYLETTPRIAMGPPLDRYMIAYLGHQDALLKIKVARAVGRYGSPAALAPLWEAFRYFHAYWDGKKAELAEATGRGQGLEDALRDAIARGQHWLVSEADLRTIESLCISDTCRISTEQDLKASQQPLRIELMAQVARAEGRVGQYNVESIEQLEQKLSQYPRGTRFALTVYGYDSSGVAARIRAFAADHGLIEPQL